MNRKKKEKVIRIKPLWRIVLNYSRVVEIHYGHAYSGRQVLEQTFRKVAKQHDVSLGIVRGMFDGTHDNFSVEIDTEWAAKAGYKIEQGR